MKSNILSGQQLVQCFDRDRQENVVSFIGGMKNYAPDGSWIEAKQLEKAHDEIRCTLQEERVSSQHSLATGEWRPDVKKVKVIKITGRHWMHMGHVEEGKTHLYPEEALFLVDTGQLEVLYGGVPLSLQEAYATLLGPHCPPDHYHVYTHLTRQGYILLRHTEVTEITPYERCLRLHQHSKHAKKKKRNRPPRKRPLPASDGGASSSKHLCVENSDDEPRDNEPRDNEPHDQGLHDGEELAQDDVGGFGYGDLTSWTQRLMDEQDDTEDVDNPPPAHRFSRWDWDEIQLPDCLGDGPVVLPRPKGHLLPPGVELCEPSYTLPRTAVRFNVKPMAYEDHLVYSHGTAGTKAMLPAQDWGEYKARYEEKAAGDWRELAPTAHLWQDEVTPLVSPEDAHSSAAILSKLSVIEQVSSGDLPQQSSEKGQEIVFDLYLPSTKFKKSQPGLPNHRILITKSGDAPPCLSDLISLERYSTDGVPVLWAVLEGASVVFYAFNSVSLPVDYTMG